MDNRSIMSQEQLEQKIEAAFQQSRLYLEHLRQRNAVFLKRHQKQQIEEEYQRQLNTATTVTDRCDEIEDQQQSNGQLVSSVTDAEPITPDQY